MIIMNAMTVPWFIMQQKGFALSCPRVRRELLTITGWPDEILRKKETNIRRPKGDERFVREGGYADDIHGASCSIGDLQRTHNLTVIWAAILQVKLNASKSLVLVMAYDKEEPVLKVGQEKLPITYDLKIVGAHIARSDNKEMPWEMEAARITEFDARIQRIQRLPLARNERLQLCASMAIPVLYSAEMSEISIRELQRMRRAVWAAGRGGRTPPSYFSLEIFFTICARGTAVDPIQALDFRAILTSCGISHADPETLRKMELERLRATGGAWGPAQRFKQALETIKWTWSGTQELTTEEGKIFHWPMDQKQKEGFKHDLREALRLREVRETVQQKRRTKGSKPRDDMQGIDAGVKWGKTRAMLDILTPFDAAILIQILVGGVMTRERAMRHRRADITSTHLCPVCRIAETREHAFWHCRRWEYLRPLWFRQLRSRLVTLKACLKLCGIAHIGYRGPKICHIQRIFVVIEKARRLYDPFPGNDFQMPPPYPLAPPGSRGPPSDPGDGDSEDGSDGMNDKRPRRSEQNPEDDSSDDQEPNTRATDGFDQRRTGKWQERHKQGVQVLDKNQRLRESWRQGRQKRFRYKEERQQEGPMDAGLTVRGGDAEEPAQDERGRNTLQGGDRRRRIRGKQAAEKRHEKREPASTGTLNKHPYASVVVENGITKCLRCKRQYKPSTRGYLTRFWSAKCWVNESTSAKGAGRAMSWFTKPTALKQALKDVAEVEKKHGHDLRWSQERWGTISCKNCDWMTLYVFMSDKHHFPIPKCTQERTCDEEKHEELQKWAKDYAKKNKGAKQGKHEYEVGERHIWCKKCLVSFGWKPRTGHALEKATCGALPRPYYGMCQDFKRR